MDERELDELVAQARDDDAQEVSSPCEEAQTVYRTQREVDAVIGKRLAQEREKLQRRYADAIALEQAMGDLKLAEGIAVLLARAHGIDENCILEGMLNTQTQEEAVEYARNHMRKKRLAKAEESIPGFSASEAMKNPAFRALMEAGEPVERAYAYCHWEEELNQARAQAQQDTLRSIRERRTRPQALRTPSGGGDYADAANLPDAVMRAIDERLKRGERVRL